MRVGLVFGGRSVEHVVSVRSARTVYQGLTQAGHDVACLGITPGGAWLPPPSAKLVLEGSEKALPASREGARASLKHLLDADVDVVFPIVHGTYGEDGTLQGLFEMLDVPYVGCGVTASAIAMDKLASKRLFEAAGLPVVPYVALRQGDLQQGLQRARALSLPRFVKPSVGGSSVGCKLARTDDELEDAVRFALRFDDVVLVEKGVKAREIEVAVLGAPGALQASAVGEIVPGNEFYDYEDKYLKDDAKLLAPAPISDAVADEVRRLAVLAMDAVGGAGMARVDFFLEGDTLYLNEINTLPGFTSVSMYPRLWGLSGVPLPQLCDKLVHLALERHKNKQRLDEALRAFVESAQ
jgi:D-alanine-D-alanine ligase